VPTDTLDSLVGRVQKRVGMLPDVFLVQEWITSAYNDLKNRIPWSFRRRQGQMVFYVPYTTGAVTINRAENTAAFSGGAVITTDHVGRQLRAGGNDTPILTITGLIDSTHVYLDQSWPSASVAAVTYEIYQAYATMPDDFDSFITVVDLQRNFQLDHWNHTADELDRIDPKRSYGGNIAYWMVLRDYAPDRQGTVTSVVQARGTGNRPTAGGSYTGPSDATFTVEMTSASVFKWKKDNGTYTTGVAIDSVGDAQDLQDGVQVAFPSTVSYTSGDVFVVRAIAAYSPGTPRYEPWPHIKADEARPYLYLAKLPDLTDANAVLPRYLRGDVLVEFALAQWAMWPGTSDKPNPAFSKGLGLAAMHTTRAENMLVDLEREDQARETTDLVYDSWTQLPVWDSGYLAGHDMGYELNVLDA
jgi:hypothetical protein